MLPKHRNDPLLLFEVDSRKSSPCCAAATAARTSLPGHCDRLRGHPSRGLPALPPCRQIKPFLSTLPILVATGAAWRFLSTLHIPVAVGAASKFRSTLLITVAAGAA